MSEFHDNIKKVVSIRPGIKKKKSETPHLDLARQILASAEPAVACTRTAQTERLAQQVALLHHTVSNMEARIRFVIIKKLKTYITVRVCASFAIPPRRMNV